MEAKKDEAISHNAKPAVGVFHKTSRLQSCVGEFEQK